MAVHNDFCSVRDEMNTILLERESAIDNALLALLTGQHFLQLGPTGTSKSMLVRALAKRIVGCNYFEKLLTGFSVPEELFGPIDLVRYADHGEYRRIATGTMTEASVAFLDEVNS